MIAYPHGIGDCILFTPILRQLHQDEKYGKISLGLDAVRAFASGLFTNCPYVDDVYPIPCPHPSSYQMTDSVGTCSFSTYSEGERVMMKELDAQARPNGYEIGMNVTHGGSMHKIPFMLGAMGYNDLPNEELYTEVFITQEDRDFAKEFVGDRKFTFIHGYSPSLPLKGFPEPFLENIRREDEVIEVGVDFQPTEFDINKQFAVMELAEKVYVIDSAF